METRKGNHMSLYVYRNILMQTTFNYCCPCKIGTSVISFSGPRWNTDQLWQLYLVAFLWLAVQSVTYEGEGRPHSLPVSHVSNML